jgi:dihydroorotate dehydrogenase
MAPYRLVRPLLFVLDAERAHGLALAAARLLRNVPPAADARLAAEVAGLRFPNPIGLAAGLDKDGEAPDAFLGQGFGFVEVGTVTPMPQPGNPRPRLFRLVEDQAVINRMGFNSGGQAAARARLARRAGRSGIVGVNIGANKDAADRIADYAAGVAAMAPVADYLTINISSPNTPGLRALQDAGALDELLEAALAARAHPIPIFLKVAPDLAREEVDAIARVAMARRVDALIVSNTTVARPRLTSHHAAESGGLSGAPLRDLALARLRDFAAATGGALPLIAAGGIASGADAYARIRAGASLVQLYTALIYQGPGLPRRMARELIALLDRDGLADIAAAVGADRR